MVLGYHIIFSCRGFWLPNDPRGSWSSAVRQWDLLRFGPATKTTARHSLVKNTHDRDQSHAAKWAMKYHPVRFTGRQALAVANGFAIAIKEAGYIVVACAVLPDHVHLVVIRHEREAERIVGHLKAKATRRLNEKSLHPLAAHAEPGKSPPSPWAQQTGWVVYLDTDEDIRRAIRYVEDNPVREGLPRQTWSFVTPYSAEMLDAARRKRRR